MPAYAHLTEEQKTNVVAKLDECGTHLDKIDAEVAANSKFVDFTQTNEQIQGHLGGLINQALTILNTKKPKEKKKEEPKKEEGPAEATPETPTETPAAEDVEMDGPPPMEENAAPQQE